jgi:hypothetical protein
VRRVQAHHAHLGLERIAERPERVVHHFPIHGEAVKN